MNAIASVITTRNITLTLCFLFALSAFGLARVIPIFLLGLAGWLMAALQTLRHASLKNDPEHKPRGLIIDIILIVIITILLSSLGYATLAFSRTVANIDSTTIQTVVFQLLVLIGGWALSWVQCIRRIRQAIAYARGKST